MKKKTLLLMGVLFALAEVFAVGVRGETAEEVQRLAELLGWRAGTVVADIGAGDGRYTFAAVARVGAAGKVYATKIDAKKLGELREEVAKRKPLTLPPELEERLALMARGRFTSIH